MRRLVVPVTLLLGVVACAGGDSPSDPDAVVAYDAGVDGGPDAPPDAPPDRPAETVQCPTAVPVPTAGICDATAGTGSAVLVRGNVLADGFNYLDGAVLYQGDKIVCSGCDCAAAPEAATATVITCGGAVVSPGLINAHDHLNYNNRAPLASTAPGGVRFEHRHEWRGEVATPPNQHGTGVNDAGMRWNELRHILSGTTSLVGSTLANGGMRNLDEPEARDTALGFPKVGWNVFPLGDGGETPRPNCTWGYTESEFQMSLHPGIVIHVSEGINERAHEEFRCQSSSFMGARDYVEKNVGHIHGVGLSTVDYFNMARDHAKLVWSPRSNLSLYGNTALAPIFHRMGGTIALGTDWTYSGSATLTREMKCVADINPSAYAGYFTDEDIWKMATRNAALATGTGNLIGTLTAGKIADLAVYRAAPGQLHRAVIDALTDDTALVIRDGDLLFGEPDVATALGQTCDPITVCGDERRVCAAREFGGQTFAQIASVVSMGVPAYPAVFCDAPAAEPTCVATRPAPNAYSGPTADDPDGDGIVAGDNCPTMFNPIRPIDRGVQPDDDADGLGDMCDPSPLKIDLDHDTLANNTDNCPFDGNTSAADTDGDGKGDVCDPCPMQANPDSVCGPASTTIVGVQNGTIAENTPVMIAGAVVTAIDSRGFMAQDPTVASGQYAGVYVFLGSAPQVAIGDRVSFTGVTDEYFLFTEISGAAVTARAAGAPLAPVAVTVAEAATEPYEGVLVTLTDVTKVDYPYSCVPDGATCADPLLFELNDSIVAWNSFYTGGSTWSTEAQAAATDMTPTVTGVMHFRFDRRRIVPRTEDDITP